MAHVGHRVEPAAFARAHAQLEDLRACAPPSPSIIMMSSGRELGRHKCSIMRVTVNPVNLFMF